VLHIVGEHDSRPDTRVSVGVWRMERKKKKAKEKTGHRAGTSCADKRENSSSGPGCRLSVIDRFVNVSSHR
jgi:hypothetical protein